MRQMIVSLPSDLQRYVDARVAAEGYADPADFMKDAVLRDQSTYEADIRRVRALIDEGVASGIIDLEPEEILDEIIADLSRRRG